jgi:Leucine-rich repeat (LRR) protein
MKNYFRLTILLLFIGCSLSGDLLKRNQAIEYYNSRDIITGRSNNLIRTMDFTGLKLKITDSELHYLQFIIEIEAIHLSRCKNITDAGLKYLSGLDNLEILNLDETNITDAGLKYIKNLKSLQELNLSHTKVTDRGIQELSGMKSLRGLVVYKTKVTQKGVDELKKKRPDLYIDLHGDQS